MIYNPSSSQDKYAKFSKEELLEKLKRDAKVINDKYNYNISRISIFNPFFDVKKRNEIQKVYSQIENFFKISFFTLLNDVLQHIFSFMQIKDLLHVAGVNKIGKESIKPVLEHRIKQFGFKEGNFFFQKKNFLNLFKLIPYMKNEADFDSFAVYNSNSTNLDFEETFKRIKNSDSYKFFLGRQLIQQLVCNKMRIDLDKWFLNMRVDPSDMFQIIESLCNAGPDANHQTPIGSYTALPLAAQQGEKEIVEILLNNKADLSLQTTKGETAFDLAVVNKKFALIPIFFSIMKETGQLKCN